MLNEGMLWLFAALKYIQEEMQSLIKAGKIKFNNPFLQSHPFKKKKVGSTGIIGSILWYSSIEYMGRHLDARVFDAKY